MSEPGTALELRQLRYFVAVAEDMSVTAAARRLRMAQPALSQAITKIERQLGTQLFHRAGGRLTLTTSGRLLLPEARALLDRADELSGLVSRIEGEQRAVLRLGSIASAVSGLLPRVLPAYLREHPWVVPRVYEMGQSAQLEALRAGTIDLGVCRMLIAEDRDLRLDRLGDEPLRCAVPCRHRLAERDEVPLAELANEDLVMFPRPLAPVAYDTVVAACGRAGFSPRFTQEASNDQSILGVVACGLALAIVPDLTTRVRVSGVSFLPLSEEYAVTPLSVLARRDDLSEAARLFRDAVSTARPPAYDDR